MREKVLEYGSALLVHSSSLLQGCEIYMQQVAATHDPTRALNAAMLKKHQPHERATEDMWNGSTNKKSGRALVQIQSCCSCARIHYPVRLR